MGALVRTRSRWITGLGLLAALAVLAVGGILAFRVVTGRGTGLKSLPRNAWSLVRMVTDRQTVLGYSQGDYRNIIFLHHSTGNNLVERGGVRELFTEAGYAFWDHSFNNPGLRDPSGKYTGYSYIVPRDNTDPDGLAHIFSQKLNDLPLNTLSGLFQHEVIVFKACFAPANNIASDAQLEQYKSWYLGMRQVMDEHPEKLFVVVTYPPLNPAETNPAEAARARAFANWLKSEEFLAGHPNIATFDYFDALAEADLSRPDANMLREDYRNGADSHPSRRADQVLGPVFVEYLVGVIEEYRAATQ